MLQPDDTVHAAMKRLLKRTKVSRVLKTGKNPDTIIFEMDLAHQLEAKDDRGWYTKRGQAYSANVGEEPCFWGLELRVGILKPLNDHWYYWYAETPD